ncbi:MAG: LLM class flavin-dependent oxidoreductase [Ilumatobacteraceae bacterium]
MTPPPRPAEFAWFGALCDDDYEQLGVVNPDLRSSWDHCRDIVAEAETAGYDNILLPSGYSLGIDTVSFASSVAPLTHTMRLLVAVRCGEVWPPQLARQLATLDQTLGGRLTVNIISSEMPGEQMDGPRRYRRTLEVMRILRAVMRGERVDIDGEFHTLHLDPPRITVENPRDPDFYFGGLSEEARDVAAQEADVYLMWPDTEDMVAATIDDMRSRAASYGRELRFGYRCHVVVRDSEDAAVAAAERLVEHVDAETGERIRSQSLDSQSTGVRRQAQLRVDAGADGFVEDNLWTGIGRARSGCGAAMVGTPAQVAAKIGRYRELGIDAFILSGYPHIEECRRFARDVLPLVR